MDYKRRNQIEQEERVREGIRRSIRFQNRTSDGSEGSGCIKVICFLVAIAIVWQFILYAGMPIALIGVGLSFWFYSGRDEVDDQGDRAGIMLAVVTGVISTIIGGISLLGNIHDEHAPFHKYLSSSDVIEKSAEPLEDSNSPEGSQMGAE